MIGIAPSEFHVVVKALSDMLCRGGLSDRPSRDEACGQSHSARVALAKYGSSCRHLAADHRKAGCVPMRCPSHGTSRGAQHIINVVGLLEGDNSQSIVVMIRARKPVCSVC